MAEETKWEYTPDTDDEPAGRPGKVRHDGFSWTASEYIDHKQGAGWFITLAAATVVIAALIFLLTRDYIATTVIAVLGLTIGIFAKRTPRELTYELDAAGIKIGAKRYPYRLFKSFSVIHDGALLSLNLEPIKRFMPPVSVYFDPADHERIFDLLEDRLPYEEKQLEFLERLTRHLRF